MASMTHSPASFAGNLASKPTALDLLRSSSSDLCGVTLKALGRAQLGTKGRDFSIVAKVKKVKKREYPWPRDPDPNVKGGVLTHLSSFKPLKEKPNPVILEFEKPLMDLQKKKLDVQTLQNETGLDLSDQIMALDNKYQEALKYVYKNLTPIQRLSIARHPNRPTFLDHVFSITEKFVELHGDRAGYDDPAIVSGLGTINGRTYMFIGHQKGRNTKENIKRNFGMPTPHGYRKALRMMYYADHHGFPIVTFIDTPGAFPDLVSEHKGQGEAIAHNLRSMFGLKVPVVSIVIGEGGSGGALAIGCANKLLMLENAVFFVASPEAAAAILYKTAKASPKAAKKLKITASELTNLQIADGVIPEPVGGAHADPYWTSQQIKTAITESMDELIEMDTENLLKHRAQKFRKLGRFIEGVPVDPERKRNMKKKEEPIISVGQTSDSDLRDEVEKLKLQVIDASKSSAERPETELKKMVARLEREIDYECDEAAKALGLKQKIMTAREEIGKVSNINDQLAHGALKEKIDQLMDEFERKLPSAPNYPSLTSKLDMLKELTNVMSLTKKSTKKDELRHEIKRRFKELMDRPDIKEKIETLKAEIKNSGLTNLSSNLELQEKVLQLNEELESEFKSVNNMIISDLKDRIDLLKAQAEKAGNVSNKDLKKKIQALVAEIKKATEEFSSPKLMEKVQRRLEQEILEATKSLEGSNGSLTKEDAEDSQAKVNLDNEHSFV